MNRRPLGVRSDSWGRPHGSEFHLPTAPSIQWPTVPGLYSILVRRVCTLYFADYKQGLLEHSIPKLVVDSYKT
jgi:hypothetical protein